MRLKIFYPNNKRLFTKMGWLTNTLTSTIGRKFVMSLTGLFLVSFLFVHLAGNFLLLRQDDGQAFNLYSQFMSTAGIIRVMEIILLLGFVLHIYTSVVLTRRNRAARPVGYAYSAPSPGTSWFSKNMGISGFIVLIFLILHLRTFWYEYKFGAVRNVYYTEQGAMSIVEAGQEANYPALSVLKDMYIIAQSAFSEWWFSLFYIIAFILLGFHLNHGFHSAFRTLGVEHKKYTPILKNVSILISILLPLGFAIIPLYFLFINPIR
jgi:succinate dehydrogenase / fumarate reductase, cytochrome b subunit